MASLVAKGSSSSSLMSVQEKGSRNKRKFRADPPLGELSKVIPPQNECPTYEFSAEKFEITPTHGQSGACDLCGINQDHSNGLKLDLGLSSAMASAEVRPSRAREELELEEFQEADWSDLTESQLEELVLSNLDAIFKSAIKKIVAYGYSEEVATKAVLRFGLCYGCKDTVSNIVDNTLAFLRSGQEINPSREHYFEDLKQLEKYILAELVCVLREVRPFFSTGDAMWCLLICDMNVSHACAMDSDPLGSFPADGASNPNSCISSQSQINADATVSELNTSALSKPAPSLPCANSPQSETPTVGGVTDITKSLNSLVLSGLSQKEISNSLSDAVEKTFSLAGTSQSTPTEEKFVSCRKSHTSTKREYLLRQKSLHLEKHYRTYGSKGSSRAGKLSGLGGLILDKKLKSVSDSASLNIKNGSVKISRAIEVNQDNGNNSFSSIPGPSSPIAFNSERSVPISATPKTVIPSTLTLLSTPPSLSLPNALTALSTADTELSLSLPTKSNSAEVANTSNVEATNCSYTAIPIDKPLGHWVQPDGRDELILKLVPRVRELQNQLQEWTEWANQKVMQAARRLSKDKAELKALRQEKEEVERLKKEKQILEENTMKKLSEMENALFKASGQVERANGAVRRLEAENMALRQEMEAAKLRAVESAANCQVMSNREKDTQMKFQSWEKEKSLFLEELATEKRKVAQLQQDVEQAKAIKEQLEVCLYIIPFSLFCFQYNGKFVHVPLSIYHECSLVGYVRLTPHSRGSLN